MPSLILGHMVQRMTPSQIRAAIQKAQRDQKRAIDNYNREVRRHNAVVKKAVDDFNREARNYNSRARAHNREVENQRRRVSQEIQRLNSRPTSTTFVAVRASTETFVRTYESVETALASRSLDPQDRRFLDLVSEEAANSAYLINALDGDGAPEDDLDENELRSPSLVDELTRFGPDLVSRWTGALFALSPANPDAARHFCTSARELVISVLDSSATDSEVLAANPRCETTDRGIPTRRAKITYLLQRHGVSEEGVSNLVAADVDNVMSLFRTFNDGTHGHAGRFTLTELTALRTRVESAVIFVHEVVSSSRSA